PCVTYDLGRGPSLTLGMTEVAGDVQRKPILLVRLPRLPPSPGYGGTSRSNDKAWNLVDSESEMVGWILKKILGSKNQREIRRMAPIVRQINELEEKFQSFSDDDLRGLTAG